MATRTQSSRYPLLTDSSPSDWFMTLVLFVVVFIAHPFWCVFVLKRFNVVTSSQDVGGSVGRVPSSSSWSQRPSLMWDAIGSKRSAHNQEHDLAECNLPSTSRGPGLTRQRSPFRGIPGALSSDPRSLAYAGQPARELNRGSNGHAEGQPPEEDCAMKPEIPRRSGSIASTPNDIDVQSGPYRHSQPLRRLKSADTDWLVSKSMTAPPATVAAIPSYQSHNEGSAHLYGNLLETYTERPSSSRTHRTRSSGTADRPRNPPSPSQLDVYEQQDGDRDEIAYLIRSQIVDFILGMKDFAPHDRKRSTEWDALSRNGRPEI